MNFKTSKTILKQLGQLLIKYYKNAPVSNLVVLCLYFFNDSVYNETSNACQIFNEHFSTVPKNYKNPNKYLMSASPSISTNFAVQKLFLFVPTTIFEIENIRTSSKSKKRVMPTYPMEAFKIIRRILSHISWLK